MGEATVVVPVHDAAATLGIQLEALATQQNAPDFDVVVVLNRCSDSSAQVAHSFEDRLQLQVVEADAVPSAAYARNVGARRTSSPFLLFCDADDCVDRNWVREMITPMAARAADVVGGRIVVDRAGLPQWIYDWRYHKLDGKCLFLSRSALPFALGASLGCTRTAFEEVGGFCEDFLGAGSEEVDFAARLLRSGFRISEAPDAIVAYKPRTTARAALRQAKGYAHGAAELAHRDGRLGPPVAQQEILWSVSKRAFHLVVRKREWRPHALYCQLAERYHRLSEQQRLRDTVRSTVVTSDVRDFVVPTSTPMIGGLALSARPAQARWYATTGVEQRSIAAVEKLIGEGETFVDCGANIGVFTLAAALRVGPTGRVVAFEPDPRSRCLLERNLGRHQVVDRVDVRSEGVDEQEGIRSFYQYDNDPVSGFGVAPAAFSPGDAHEIPVEVVTLSDVLDGQIHMLKIDVEGFETAVLRGAAGLLERSADAAILLELNPAALRSAGYEIGDLLESLPPRWSSLWLIDDRADSSADAFQAFDDRARAAAEAADPSWYGNLLALPSHRADQMTDLLRSRALR